MIVHAALVSDAVALRARVQRLVPSKLVVLTVLDEADGPRELLSAPFDLVFIAQTAIPADGAELLLERLERLPASPAIVVLTSSRSPEDHARFLEAGFLAAIWTGLPDARFGGALRSLVKRRANEAARAIKARRMDRQARLSDFVSKSPAMQSFMGLVGRVATADTTVLVLGETGVGKGRLARAVHAESPRESGPFIAINCGALPETLLESELFGHARGAFTGAQKSRRGYFEVAHGGTLLLDEVGELSPALQVKLLRVLDEREVWPVGNERPIPVDVRLIAATNRDLEAEVAAGRFRRDLFYRLAVVTLTVPPLRLRRDDIAALVRSYVGHFAVQLGRTVDEVDDEAFEALTRYDWPGNVRELMNAIERAVLLCPGRRISLADLPEQIAGAPLGDARAAELADLGIELPGNGQHLVEVPWRTLRANVIQRLERAYLEQLMAVSGGRIGKAAKKAGLNERSLYDKLRRYGLAKEK